MQIGDVPLEEIRNIYGKVFPGTGPHHIVPRSRKGSSSHFNIFPYKKRAHSAYHSLFWNMRIDEVWENLDEIYESIFESDDESVCPWWFACCTLDGKLEKREGFEVEKKLRLNKPVGSLRLQELWFKAFGGHSLGRARTLLKYMMLFMVFGINVADTDSLFDNGNLRDFLEKYPSGGYRLWAFEICFGKNGAHIHSIKAKTSKILRKVEDASS